METVARLIQLFSTLRFLCGRLHRSVCVCVL